MQIGLYTHNASEDRLLFARQISAQCAGIWGKAIPKYATRCYLTTANVVSMQARFDKYQLELTGISKAWQVGYIRALLQAIGS